jgi:hypothetical protein
MGRGGRFPSGWDADVGGEVVESGARWATLGESGDVGDEQRALDQAGVVEVLQGTLGDGQVGQVAIVVVEVEVDAVEGAGQLGSQRGFAGAGAAGDGQQHWRKREGGFIPPGISWLAVRAAGCWLTLRLQMGCDWGRGARIGETMLDLAAGFKDFFVAQLVAPGLRRGW